MLETYITSDSMGSNQLAAESRFHLPPAMCRGTKIYMLPAAVWYGSFLPSTGFWDNKILLLQLVSRNSLLQFKCRIAQEACDYFFFSVHCFCFEKDQVVLSDVLINSFAFKLWTAAAPLKCNSKYCSYRIGATEWLILEEITGDYFVQSPLFRQDRIEQAAVICKLYHVHLELSHSVLNSPTRSLSLFMRLRQPGFWKTKIEQVWWVTF